jgi:hypothetical protein
MITEKLRSELKKSEIPMAQAADYVGIHRVGMQNFKTGKFDMRVEHLEKLAKLLGYEIRLVPVEK